MQLWLYPLTPLCRESMEASAWQDAQVHVLRLLGWQLWQLLALPWFVGKVCGRLKLAGVQAEVLWHWLQPVGNSPAW